MIWLINGDESHEIISCNTAHKQYSSEVWVTRPNGKNLKVFESKNLAEINELKEAIDFAVKTGEKTFRLE